MSMSTMEPKTSGPDRSRLGLRTQLVLAIRDAVFGLAENPVLVKHRRTRLRRNQVIPAAVVVVVLCLCLLLVGYSQAIRGGAFSATTVFGFTLILQSILLAVMGASQITSSVGGARESGIIDFHRVSPQSPLSLTLGFFFGAPIREYLLAALTLPLSFLCVYHESPSISGFLQTIVVLLISSWLMHAVALLTALTTKKPKSGGARGVVGFVIFMIFFGGSLGSFLIGRAANVLNQAPTMRFFGVEIPWLLFTLIYTIPPLVFIVLACVRKMQSERNHAYNKPEAITAMSLFAFLLVAALWGLPEIVPVASIMVYALIVVGAILLTTVTPNRGEYCKGVLRAEREGHRQLGPFANWSLNRVVVVVFAAILLVAASVAGQSQVSNPGGLAIPRAEFSSSITIASAVFVLAYVGFGFQAFQLSIRKRATAYFMVFLFLAWILPMLIGLIIESSGVSQTGRFLAALSPVTGLALSMGVSDDESVRIYQAACFCPAVLFAFVFNNMVVYQRRKAELELRTSALAAARKPEAVDAFGA